ncbi:Phosphoserine phosphatase RsbU [Aquisphaera giovannonii]|uniref:Phosphoserine phosphatase RsbU n=1 Tax=Aquisphaera giovannonii TaxID=406548 RepID=A0A5B9WFC1_9BACT|nr:PP2C family protein-serine/threonine phosphatase [Aquisphaera giovannonii]QEH38934.1 Phosphoserine phosphatase RsbU [Aquisphaera giovannonii]
MSGTMILGADELDPAARAQVDRIAKGDWQTRLAAITEMMREMSLQEDPQDMVRDYGARVRAMLPGDLWLSLSRRGLEFPRYRITRSSTWSEVIDPWKQKDRLPLLEGGLLAELIYADEPRLINDAAGLISPDDPAFEYLEGVRSLMAMPHFQKGDGLNMVVNMSKRPNAYDPEQFPDRFWISSLFGRATQSLVLSKELKEAYEIVDRELKVVADIQRSLLPQTLPNIPGLELAAHYQTSQWAGGDYYDFFELPDGRWGFLIADVSGHGTPAAVMMAILHSLAHGVPGHPEPPSALLEHVNRRLAARYTTSNEVFVTAFYGIYDPATRVFAYSCAGHNPPQLKRCSQGKVDTLEEVGGPPLGVFDDLTYDRAEVTLRPGDVLVLYTDGITEAMNARSEQFGLDQLNGVLARCHLDAPGIRDAILEQLSKFTDGTPAHDDRTLLVAKVL